MIDRCSLPAAEISRRAHHHLQHSRQRKHQEILAVLTSLSDFQDLTASELAQRLPAPAAENGNRRARLLELRRRDKIVVACVRVCRVTGRTCRAYRAALEGEAAPALEPETTTKRELGLEVENLRKALAETSKRLEQLTYDLRKARSDRDDYAELAREAILLADHFRARSPLAADDLTPAI